MYVPSTGDSFIEILSAHGKLYIQLWKFGRRVSCCTCQCSILTLIYSMLMTLTAGITAGIDLNLGIINLTLNVLF